MMRMNACRFAMLLGLTSLGAGAQEHASNLGPVPRFDATALTGESVTQRGLIGQPTVLIVTPSRDAANDTRQWAEALRRNLDPQQVRVRDVLAIDLPFFMSTSHALSVARDEIPERYHSQTWLLTEPMLEDALGIPTDSSDAYVLVLDSQGQVAARAHGSPTEDGIARIRNAVSRLTG